jgi:hypothetical protein
VADAALKDLIPQMEHPFYSLSKKRDIEIRRSTGARTLPLARR